LVLNRGGGVPGVAAIRRFDLAELEVAVSAPLMISWRMHIAEFGIQEFPRGFRSVELLVPEGRRKSRRRVHLM
jgi:hypothetical protein